MIRDTGIKLILAFKKQTEKVAYFCSVVNTSPNLAVHEMRKSFKRMRALIKFYSDLPDRFPRESFVQICRFGKNISLLRESFVNIQLFEKLISNHQITSEKKVKQIKEKLRTKNKVLIKERFIENQDCFDIENFVDKFQLQINNIERPAKKQIFSQVCISYLKGYTVFKQLQPGLDAVKLHQLRKKLKRLWYQFDFVKSLYPKYFQSNTDQLHKITEQLGNEHDLYVFLNEIKRKEYYFDNSEIEIFEKYIQHLRELNLLKLTARLKQLLSDAPEVFNQKMEQVFDAAEE